MAKIVGKEGVKIVDTYCEHMGKVGVFYEVLGKNYCYCPICGQKLHKEEPITREVCSACRMAVSNAGVCKHPRFCVWCGVKFDGSD